MILKVHPSNYRIEGFHEEVSSRELAALAHKHGLLFYEDQGSGALLPDDILVRGGEETYAGFGCGGARYRCRARAISCWAPRRRALSWAVAIWSRPVGHIRLCAPCARASSR